MKIHDMAKTGNDKTSKASSVGDESSTPSRLLDFQAIGRVIDAVRKTDNKLGKAFLLPQSKDPQEWKSVRGTRSDLSGSISWAYTFRNVHADWTSDSRAKRRYAALARVRKLSKELVRLIDDDDLPLRRSVSPHFSTLDANGYAAVDLSQMMVGLRHLQQACEKESARLKALGWNDKAILSEVGGRTNAQSTQGTAFISHLGKSFQEAFGQKPKIRFTSSREPTGPFVAFVQAVTAEMNKLTSDHGDPMSADGIRKAWDRADSGGTNT